MADTGYRASCARQTWPDARYAAISAWADCGASMKSRSPFNAWPAEAATAARKSDSPSGQSSASN